MIALFGDVGEHDYDPKSVIQGIPDETKIERAKSAGDSFRVLTGGDSRDSASQRTKRSLVFSINDEAGVSEQSQG